MQIWSSDERGDPVTQSKNYDRHERETLSHLRLTDLSEVRVVDMSNNMEQQLLDLLQHHVEVGGELIAMFGGEDGFVVDHLLYVGHHIVHILGRRDLALLPLVIHPHVCPGARSHHLRAGGQVTELGDCAVQQVDVLEEAYGCNEG